MPLPSATKFLKIHPSIGIARQSSNDDYFVVSDIDDFHQDQYKSNNLIKRQAVRFRIVAYNSDGDAIEELTPERMVEMGLSHRWIVSLANKKTAIETDDSYLIEASGRSDLDAGNLIGKCGDFDEGQSIQLGTILPDGVFIPPKSVVAARVSGSPMPEHTMYDKDFTDNVSDGPISVEIFDTEGTQINIKVFESWVVVAPPDFAPDWDDKGYDVPPQPNNKNLLQHLETVLNRTGSGNVSANPLNKTAQRLNAAHLTRGTANFGPGMETSEDNLLSSRNFYPASALKDPAEIRIKSGLNGAQNNLNPGDLTMGLCSPWQFDFRACSCSWWANQRPDVAFKDGILVNWRRREEGSSGTSPSGGLMKKNSQFVRHVDELGIVRKQDPNSDSENNRIETERDDDIDDGGGFV